MTKVQCSKCDNETDLVEVELNGQVVEQLPEGWGQDVNKNVHCPQFYEGLKAGDIRRGRPSAGPILRACPVCKNDVLLVHPDGTVLMGCASCAKAEAEAPADPS